MPAKPGSERQRRYRERMKASGLVQIMLMVPSDRLDEMHRVAAEMRDKHLAESASDD